MSFLCKFTDLRTYSQHHDIVATSSLEGGSGHRKSLGANRGSIRLRTKAYCSPCHLRHSHLLATNLLVTSVTHHVTPVKFWHFKRVRGWTSGWLQKQFNMHRNWLPTELADVKKGQQLISSYFKSLSDGPAEKLPLRNLAVPEWINDYLGWSILKLRYWIFFLPWLFYLTGIYYRLTSFRQWGSLGSWKTKMQRTI